MAIATLIINPAAGRAQQLRAQLPAIIALLAAHGFTTRHIDTSTDVDYTRAITEIALQSSSLILACGGDGTMHAVLQAVVQHQGGGVTLGVVPLGTANVLARYLALPLDPLSAVEKLLTYTPRVIPVGQIDSSAGCRYFVAMAGCGPDGALANLLSGFATAKARFGRTAYSIHAARLFFTRRWPTFAVRYRLVNGSAWHSTTAVAVLASRLPNLGGIFASLTPLAALTDAHLHINLLRPPAQLSFPAWFACSSIGLPNPWLQTLDVAELQCSSLSQTPVHAQADAEPLGPLPLALRVVPDAFSLLMPPQPFTSTHG